MKPGEHTTALRPGPSETGLCAVSEALPRYSLPIIILNKNMTDLARPLPVKSVIEAAMAGRLPVLFSFVAFEFVANFLRAFDSSGVQLRWSRLFLLFCDSI